MTNSADPDQLASSEANWSGSTLFAKAGHIRDQQDQVKWWQHCTLPTLKKVPQLAFSLFVFPSKCAKHCLPPNPRRTDKWSGKLIWVMADQIYPHRLLFSNEYSVYRTPEKIFLVITCVRCIWANIYYNLLQCQWRPVYLHVFDLTVSIGSFLLDLCWLWRLQRWPGRSSDHPINRFFPGYRSWDRSSFRTDHCFVIFLCIPIVWFS